jgi:hypothetical protein
MKLVTAVILAALSLSTARASGYVGVYALIDKVVMEPNADNPERIQIFGVFSIATDKQVFQPAQRGYLYFKLSGDNQALIRREWADLKAAAGARTVISFGGSGFAGSFSTIPRLRKPDEKPSAPDPYVLGAGLNKMRSDTDYGPIKSLLEYH